MDLFIFLALWIGKSWVKMKWKSYFPEETKCGTHFFFVLQESDVGAFEVPKDSGILGGRLKVPGHLCGISWLEA